MANKRGSVTGRQFSMLQTQLKNWLAAAPDRRADVLANAAGISKTTIYDIAAGRTTRCHLATAQRLRSAVRKTPTNTSDGDLIDQFRDAVLRSGAKKQDVDNLLNWRHGMTSELIRRRFARINDDTIEGMRQFIAAYTETPEHNSNPPQKSIPAAKTNHIKQLTMQPIPLLPRRRWWQFWRRAA